MLRSNEEVQTLYVCMYKGERFPFQFHVIEIEDLVQCITVSDLGQGSVPFSRTFPISAIKVKVPTCTQ